MNDLPTQMTDRRSDERRRGRERFDRWRRRVVIAFSGLALANAGAIAWVYDTRLDTSSNDRARQREIARQQNDIAQILVEVQNGRRTTLDSICAIDNAQNTAIRRVLLRFKISTEGFARIDCTKLIDEANADRTPDKPGSLKDQAEREVNP